MRTRLLTTARSIQRAHTQSPFPRPQTLCFSNNCAREFLEPKHHKIEPLQTSSVRAFSSTPTVLKKGGKNKSPPEPVAGPTTKGGPTPGADDPNDVSALEAGIARAHDRLKEDLSKLRAGGRFNPELVENLRVALDKGGKETVRLGDVAQVVPRGRVLNVLVGEKEHVKSVSSAIQGSSLSLTPQPDAQNPLQLNVPLPPPTAESRREAVKQATAAAEAANTAIRNTRGAQQKRLNAMKVAKTARPDDLKKAGDRMEKVVEKGSAEVKKIVDAAKKVLESV